MTVQSIEWPIQPLGELVDILDSRRVPVSANERSKRPGEVPYYGASGPVGTIDKHIFDEPLLLLGEDGVQFFDSGKSKSYLIEGPAWVNNHAHVLRARPMVERKFLNYYLNHCDYRGFANGTTRLKLTQAAMRQIPVPVPLIAEQRHIVDLLEDHLSRLDAAGRGLATALARSEALLTAGLWDATHGLHEGAAVELQSIAEVRLGRQRSPKNHTASGSPAEVGKSVMYRGEPADVCFQNTLLRVRCHSADPEFVQKYLLAEARVGQFMPEARGVGINHLGRARLASLQVDLPSIEAQREAVARCRRLVDEVSRLKSALNAQVARSSGLRRSLLASAFSGRLTGAESRATSTDTIEELAGV